METRTKDKLIQAINTRKTAIQSGAIPNGKMNEEYVKYADNDFNIPVPSTPTLEKQLISLMKDIGRGLQIHDVNGNDITFTAHEKEKMSDYSSDINNDDDGDDNEKAEFFNYMVTKLQQAFGGHYWYATVMAYTQEPQFLLKDVPLGSVHSYDMSSTIMLDFHSNDAIVKLGPQIINKQEVICYSMVVPSYSISDTDEWENDKFKKLDVIDGPFTSIFYLMPIETKSENDPQVTGWVFQLQSISSPSPTIMGLFEGKVIAEMEIPLYAALIEGQHEKLLQACQTYLTKLFYELSLEASTLGNPFYKLFPDLKESLQSLMSHPTGFDDLADFALKYEKLRNAEIESCCKHAERFRENMQHAALVGHLMVILTKTVPEKMPNAIHAFAKLLLTQQATLRQNSTQAALAFAQTVHQALEKKSTGRLVEVLKIDVRNKVTQIFATGSFSSTSITPTSQQKKI